MHRTADRRATTTARFVAALAASIASCSSSRLVGGVDGSTAVATTDAIDATTAWRDDAVTIPMEPDATLQSLAAIVPGRLAIGSWSHHDGLSRTSVWALHSDDGRTWTRTSVELSNGEELLQPQTFWASLVTPDASYVLAEGPRLIDPHLADGSGVHGDPIGRLGMIWWTKDGGATWSHAVSTEEARFFSIAFVAGQVWIGGEVGEQPNSIATIWSLDSSGVLHDEGPVPSKGEFQQVIGFDDIGGDVVATVALSTGSARGVHLVNGTWTDTAVPPQPVLSPDGLGGRADRIPYVLHDGTLTVEVASLGDRDALAFCFQDASTCRRLAVAAAVRDGEGEWRRIAVPADITQSLAFTPAIVDHELTIYSGGSNSPPDHVFSLPLDPSVLPLFHAPPEPPLPAPQFDGTLVVGQPRALELQIGCGSERIDINGTTMEPVSLPPTFAADVQQRPMNISDGPNIAVYVLIELRADGTVHLLSVGGTDLATYRPATPPQGFCG